MKPTLYESHAGDFVVCDEDECVPGIQKPLISIAFHNEAKRLPQEVKKKLVLQMVDPEVKAPAIFLMGCLGALTGVLATLFVEVLVWFLRKA